MALRAGVYTRLSRLKDTDELTTLGMDRQAEDTVKLATARGWEVVRTYADTGISAGEGNHRPDFDQAITDLREHTIDVLVVKSLDRLTRSLADLLLIERVLKDSGGALVSCADGDVDTTTGPGRFMLRQRAMVAEMYLDDLKAKVTRWHEQRAHAGKPLVSGRRPFGYKDKQRSAVDPAEADVIERAAEMLLKGKSLNYVTAWANNIAKSKSPTGKPWLARTFGAMIQSPGIAGLRSYRGEVVAVGKWTAILDRPTHEALVAKFNGTKGKPGRPPTHLLSGLLRCGRCGHPMLWAHHRDRKRGLPDRDQYICRKRPGAPNCGRMVVSASPVEGIVGAEVLAHLDADKLERHLASLDDGKAAAAADELEAARKRRDELETMWRTDAIDQDEYLRLRGPVRERVERAKRVLGSITSKSVLVDLPTDPAELAAWWDDATTDERREVVTASLTRVLIRPSGPRMNTFDAGRVVIPPDAWKV
jgi:site-specific DNA recombinase